MAASYLDHRASSNFVRLEEQMCWHSCPDFLLFIPILFTCYCRYTAYVGLTYWQENTYQRRLFKQHHILTSFPPQSEQRSRCNCTPQHGRLILVDTRECHEECRDRKVKMQRSASQTFISHARPMGHASSPHVLSSQGFERFGRGAQKLD